MSREKDSNDKENDRIQLQSDAIYLRPMEIADTENIVAWRNNPRVRHNFIYQALFTVEGHLQWIHTQVETGRVVQFIICEKKSGRAVGSVYFRDIDTEKKWAEYGIFIGEDDAAGKGYGTEAARLALAYAFDRMKMRFIYLRVFADNACARKSYENAGFQLIKGKQDEVVIDAQTRKIVFYGFYGFGIEGRERIEEQNGMKKDMENGGEADG